MSKLINILFASCLVLTAYCSLVTAQSDTAQLSGTVVDQNGDAVPGAKVSIMNPATGMVRSVTSNESGAYVLSLLPPAAYTVMVEANGFKRVQLLEIVLNVGDRKGLKVPLSVGDVNAPTVDVTSEVALVKTDAAVGTVIDGNMVENIPTNARSIQSLMALIPGVVQVPVFGGAGGQFVVNGQRADSSNISVDGVSGGTGVAGAIRVAGSGVGVSGGSAFGFTQQGTSASLVSQDALQEFRIQTSTYSAEFGRVPGGQISLVSKSGQNKFHGTAFETFRHNALDATDWFTNANGLQNPPLRQNLFGGTFSGPVVFPRLGDGNGDWLWKGKERLWFFFSYEGLRLTQPKTDVTTVPTLARRAEAHPLIRPLLEAFPIPNGAEVRIACTMADPLCDAATLTRPSGFAKFAAAWSNRSEYDATAIKIDYKLNSNMSIFGRYSDTPSFSSMRTLQLSTIQSSYQKNKSLTVGNIWVGPRGATNDFRINWAFTDAPTDQENDTFGGAALPPTSFFGSGRALENTNFQFTFTIPSVPGGATPLSDWAAGGNKQRNTRQLNIVDTFSLSRGSHTFKFGVDYRSLSPQIRGEGGGFIELVRITNLGSLAAPQVTSFNLISLPTSAQTLKYDQLSLFAQDTWKVIPKMTLDLGLRWELVPPPTYSVADEAVTFSGIDSPGAAALIRNSPGTPIYKTRFDNFAPRIGVSYLVSDRPGQELVLRGGFGIYYDLGYGDIASVGFGQASKSCPAASRPECPTGPLTFPLNPSITASAPIGRPTALVQVDPDHRKPFTYQYNFSVERSFGANQVISLSFVGADGRLLLRPERYRVTLPGYPLPTGLTNVALIKNGGHSDYRALQAQYQRRMHRNIQALVAYTWSRSRDTDSNDIAALSTIEEIISPGFDYGNSSFDLRHSFNAAISLQMPKLGGPALWRALVNDWSFDAKFLARSGFPISGIIIGRSGVGNPDFPNTNFLQLRPNLVPGQPIWIDNPAAPGGKQLNRFAFADPGGFAHGDLPRNSIFGFGARQVDAAVRREFGLSETVRLKLGIEVFNVTNTPNFSNPSGTSPNLIVDYGKSTSTLASGLGGLNSLYQIGGPRSLQLSAKVSF